MAPFAPMAFFDLVLRGGTLIDGTGSPGRRADVGVVGDRIAAVGDLSAAGEVSVGRVVDCAGRVVAPGFIDPHGHSDGSVLVDGTLASHLHQGFTTQVSGNCGGSAAPVTDAGRELIDLQLRPDGVVPRWRTFAEYLNVVAEQPLGPNVAFLVGQGTIRGSVMGASSRPASAAEAAAMVREVEAAMDAGAFGLSSGLIYAPGMHAPAGELAALVRATASRGGLYATHIRNEAGGLFGALEEAIATVRDAGPGARLQVSHLKCAAEGVRGRAAHAVALLDAARAQGLDVAADQYPYTAAATTLGAILPPALLALGVDECVRALGDRTVRQRTRSEIDAGNSSWERVTSDPGWAGIRISHAASHPDWAGCSFAELGKDLGQDPAEVAFDALIDDRLDVSIVIDCMTEPDVETILAVPWIAICTDAEGRRPGHPVLDAGRPHPRTYGSTARVLGRYVRERCVLALETAVAKLTSVPAERLGLSDRGVAREGAFADLLVFDATSVRDEATYTEPACYPSGIEHVIVNGRPAISGGRETGERPGRLLRHA
jgi:N-acyl-D-amino-acid deacylase